MAFRKLWIDNIQIGIPVPFWGEIKFSGYLIRLEKNGMSVNMFEAVAMGIGMLKSSIKMGRGYQSNAMDEYFDPEKLGMEFRKKMIRRL